MTIIVNMSRLPPDLVRYFSDYLNAKALYNSIRRPLLGKAYNARCRARLLKVDHVRNYTETMTPSGIVRRSLHGSNGLSYAFVEDVMGRRIVNEFWGSGRQIS